MAYPLKNLRLAAVKTRGFSLVEVMAAMPAAPAVLPDPCEIASTANLVDALAYPVQGYRTPDLATAADVSASTCDNKNLLTAANLKPGSDVLVIRRAATTNLAPTDVAALNEVYIQANAASIPFC